MNTTRLLLAAGTVLLLCSLALAQSKPQYRTGRLSQIKDATDLMDITHKASLLLLIRDGNAEYIGHYQVTFLGHVNKTLVAGKDVLFRVSGKSLFVKAPDGKEIKARLCDRVGGGVRCGSVFFGNIFPSNPNSD